MKNLPLLALSTLSLLVLGEATGARGELPLGSGPYRAMTTGPVVGPARKVGSGPLTEFDALTDAMNQMYGEGYEPGLFDIFVDFRRFDYGQNRFLLGGRESPHGRTRSSEEPYRAVLTRPISGPAWKAGQSLPVEFPAVTAALNQLHGDGYEPIHMEVYTDPVPPDTRPEQIQNRLLIVARRR